MIIFGASGHGGVVVDVAQCLGVSVERVIDDNPRCMDVLGIPVLRAERAGLPAEFDFIVAIGDNASRERVYSDLTKLGGHPKALIHPSSTISPHACCGRGVVCCAGAVVNSGAQIGDNCIINTSASVDHDCVIRDHVHICPGVRLAGNVTVGDGTVIGTGAIVIPGIKIGAWSVIGAGSVVCRDVPDGVVAYGNPARLIRRVDELKTKVDDRED